MWTYTGFCTAVSSPLCRRCAVRRDDVAAAPGSSSLEYSVGAPQTPRRFVSVFRWEWSRCETWTRNSSRWRLGAIRLKTSSAPGRLVIYIYITYKDPKAGVRLSKWRNSVTKFSIKRDHQVVEIVSRSLQSQMKSNVLLLKVLSEMMETTRLRKIGQRLFTPRNKAKGNGRQFGKVSTRIISCQRVVGPGSADRLIPYWHRIWVIQLALTTYVCFHVFTHNAYSYRTIPTRHTTDTVS